MIYGTIKNQLKDIDQQIKICLAYVENERLAEKEPGSYQIDDNNLYVNVVTYETSTIEDKVWEAHKKYIDLHYMLNGKERIDMNFIDNMIQESYHEEDDFLALKGDKSASVVINTGEYAVCFPEDAHKPGIQVKQSEMVKKAIFKIALDTGNIL